MRLLLVGLLSAGAAATVAFLPSRVSAQALLCSEGEEQRSAPDQRSLQASGDRAWPLRAAQRAHLRRVGGWGAVNLSSGGGWLWGVPGRSIRAATDSP